MSYWKSFGLAIFAMLCLLGETAGRAAAQATVWSGGRVRILTGVQGSPASAYGINDSGEVVGSSYVGGGQSHATEWSGDKVIDLGGLPGFRYSFAQSINDAGQAVGYSIGSMESATEWNGGGVIDLGGLPGSIGGVAVSINNAGQAVGASFFMGGISGPGRVEQRGRH
jgi:probable HAF family extracellular repeat protein